MAQLRQDYVQFAERNVAILVVGPENADAFVAFWQREKLPFFGLAAAGSALRLQFVEGQQAVKWIVVSHGGNEWPR